MNDFVPDVPGPGAYNVSESARFLYKQDPKFSLSSRFEQSGVQVLPGPGNYAPNKNCILTSAPQFTMRSRNSDVGEKQLPAPNAYNPSPNLIQKTPPSFTFHRRSSTGNGAGNPGPGAYSPEVVRETERREAARSFSDRFGSVLLPTNLVANPSPNQYNADHNLTALKQPLFTMRSRVEDPGKQTTPGPGAYNVRRASGAPSFSMYERHRANFIPE